MVKERLIFTTGRPVDPHQPISDRLQIGPHEGFKKWVWPKLIKCMIDPLGFPTGIDCYEKAAKELRPARRSPDLPNASDDEQENDDHLLPDSSGYHIVLADGTASRIRFRKALGGARPAAPCGQSTGFQTARCPSLKTTPWQQWPSAFWSTLTRRTWTSH